MTNGPRRGALERRVRSAWGEPGSLLRALASVYGGVADIRNLLWDAGVFRPTRSAVPVISLGGLSTGGSGKTPLAAAFARHLSDAGGRVAVLTAGQQDELRLHQELNPDVAVLGGRWRIPLARQAVRDGAEVLVLDSGFQHRRLHRDLELVACNVDQVGNRERLPAGPYRERFAALVRADAVILMRRVATPDQARALKREVLGIASHLHVARVRLRPNGLRASNDAAAAAGEVDPAVAVAGVMWPESFFRWLAEEDVHPDHRFALPDHARYGGRMVNEISAAAGERGLVCTRKDAVRLVPLVPPHVPVWWLAEEIEWEAGSDVLLAGVRRTAGVGG